MFDNATDMDSMDDKKIKNYVSDWSASTTSDIAFLVQVVWCRLPGLVGEGV